MNDYSAITPRQGEHTIGTMSLNRPHFVGVGRSVGGRRVV